MLAQLIPDGPLHPDDAVAAVLIGLSVGLLLRRRRRAWAPAIVLVIWAVVEGRYGTAVADGFSAQGSSRLALVGLVAVVAATALRPWRRTHLGIMVLGALAGVWAVVPDTEAPLIAGALLAAALVASSGTGRRLKATRLDALLVLLPAVAAITGVAGRPERLTPALGTAVLGALLTVAGLGLVGQVWRSRAGTPTTVAPDSTSSTTTAPAPITAP